MAIDTNVAARWPAWCWWVSPLAEPNLCLLPCQVALLLPLHGDPLAGSLHLFSAKLPWVFHMLFSLPAQMDFTVESKQNKSSKNHKMAVKAPACCFHHVFSKPAAVMALILHVAKERWAWDYAVSCQGQRQEHLNPESLLPAKGAQPSAKQRVGKSCVRVLQVGRCLNPQLFEDGAGLRRVWWGDVLKFIAQGCGCNFFWRWSQPYSFPEKISVVQRERTWKISFKIFAEGVAVTEAKSVGSLA